MLMKQTVLRPQDVERIVPVKRTLFELDVLRIVGMALILYQHAGTYIGWDPKIPKLLPNPGSIGLTIFFFISGFLLKRSLLSKPTTFNARDFLKRRFVRIIPLYWISVLVFVLVFHVWHIFRYADFSPLSATVVANFLGVQLFFVPKVAEIFTIWYMGALIPYYVLFTLSAKLKPIRYFALNLLILGGLYGIKAALAANGIVLIDTRLLVHYPTFLLGVFYAGLDINFDFVRRHKQAIFVGFAMLMLIFLRRAGNAGIQLDPLALESSTAGYYTLCLLGGICFTALAFWIAPVAKRFPKLVAALSVSSYAVYLFHRPIYSLFYSQVLERVSEAPSVRTLLFPVATALVIALSYAIARAESQLLKPKLVRLLRLTR